MRASIHVSTTGSYSAAVMPKVQATAARAVGMSGGTRSKYTLREPPATEPPRCGPAAGTRLPDTAGADLLRGRPSKPLRDSWPIIVRGRGRRVTRRSHQGNVQGPRDTPRGARVRLVPTAAGQATRALRASGRRSAELGRGSGSPLLAARFPRSGASGAGRTRRPNLRPQ